MSSWNQHLMHGELPVDAHQYRHCCDHLGFRWWGPRHCGGRDCGRCLSRPTLWGSALESTAHWSVCDVTSSGVLSGVRIWFRLEMFGVRERGSRGQDAAGVSVSPSPGAFRQPSGWGSAQLSGGQGRWHVTGWPGPLWLAQVHLNE